jgi:hypothetical protein
LGTIIGLLQGLQALPFAKFIHDTAWAFTTVEVVHVVAVSFLLATIAIVDLRLLGLASVKRPVSELTRNVLPFTWAAFVIAALAGLLLFTSRAADYFVSPIFWTKMGIIVLAGINMLIFEFLTVRDVDKWDSLIPPPRAAQIAGGLSLGCWILVVVFGRWIGFSLLPE